MALPETYCILLLAVLAIATAITVAATLSSLYRKEPPAQIVFLKDGRRELFKLSSDEVEKLRGIIARELYEHGKITSDDVSSQVE